jgi:hypothetical protein
METRFVPVRELEAIAGGWSTSDQDQVNQALQSTELNSPIIAAAA